MATAGAWLRRLVVAAAPMPRIPCALPDLPTPPPPAPVLEAPALALPARGAAMDLMAVPKKKVGHPLLLMRSLVGRGLPDLWQCGVWSCSHAVCRRRWGGDQAVGQGARTRCSLDCS